MNLMRIAVGGLALALVVGSCAGGGDASGAGTVETSTTTAAAASSPTGPPPVTSAPGPTSERAPLADLVRSAGSLRFDPESVAPVPQPIRVDIESIGVTGADVRDVGVAANGELEVPGADEVGWYRWSPSPGRAGSAVLAAHIAYNGADGVFRRLADLDVDDLVTVGYDDGSTREFRIVERSQYPKDELPLDRIFARDGEPVVALITCGGTFNRALRSYDDNVVAYAAPT